MKLSTDTLNVLKNFASINSNIVINEGNVLKTMAEAKNVMASATIEEDFEGTFGIYDLSEFLSVYNMFDDPTLVFAEDMNSVTIKEGRSAVKYFFSDPSILTSPSKDIKMPSTDVAFTLTAEDLASIRRASSALGCSEFVVTEKDGQLIGAVTDSRNPTSNEFTIELSQDGESSVEGFSYVYSIPNLKLIGGDYTVEISNKLISQFRNEAGVKYFVALEKSSKVGE